MITKITGPENTIETHIILYGIGRASPSLLAKSLRNLQSYLPSNTKLKTTHILLKVDQINNPRTKEQYEQGDLNLFSSNVDELLIMHRSELEEQSSVNRTILQNYNDVYKDDYKSLNNFFNQLLLLEFAAKNAIDEATDILIFCRDDIYVSEAAFVKFPKIEHNDVILPGFHWHRGYNDRFIASSTATSRLWALRINALERFYLNERNLTGEKLVKFILDNQSLNLMSLPRIFPRIRHNDVLVKEKNPFSLNRPKELIKIMLANLRLLIRLL